MLAGDEAEERRASSSPARCTRSARPRSSSPAATATRPPTSFFDGEQLHAIPGERHADGAAHGSGCTHSSALAAHLALGFAPLEAARAARGSPATRSATACARSAPAPGPVDVFDLTTARSGARLARRAVRPPRRRVT